MMLKMLLQGCGTATGRACIQQPVVQLLAAAHEAKQVIPGRRGQAVPALRCSHTAQEAIPALTPAGLFADPPVQQDLLK